MRLLRYALQLLRSLLTFAKENKAWWIVPLVVILALLTLILSAGQASTPFIYTFF